MVTLLVVTLIALPVAMDVARSCCRHQVPWVSIVVGSAVMTFVQPSKSCAARAGVHKDQQDNASEMKTGAANFMACVSMKGAACLRSGNDVAAGIATALQAE